MEIDINKTMKRYEARGNLDYPDSTFYRKEKQPVIIKDKDKVYGLRKVRSPK